MEEEYRSVHEINSNRTDTNETKYVNVYQVQGIENTNTGLIIKAGVLENRHDTLIREFEILKKFKCFMVSRLYKEDELVKEHERYQMIKIIICKKDCDMNNPLAYLCFNFHPSEHHLSTHENRIKLNGFFSITFHFMETNIAKYIQLYKNEEYIGNNKMMTKLIEHLYHQNVLKVIDKLI